MKRLTARLLAVVGFALFLMSGAQAATVAGIMTLHLTIDLTTAVPTGGSVECELTITTTDGGLLHTEHVIATATVSGAAATCVAPIPYLWSLSTPGSDSITITYRAAILPASGSTTAVGLRDGTHTLPSIVGVPASGTHTGLTAETRL